MSENAPPLALTQDQLDYVTQSVIRASLATPLAWGPPGRLVLGDNVHLANTLLNTSSGTIEIGDDTFFGHHVCLLTGTHDHRKKGRARQEAIPGSGRDIRIGRGVWVSSNVTILGPCTIGDDAVIAAGSVVPGGNLPGGYVYAGVPARPIKAIEFDSAESDKTATP